MHIHHRSSERDVILNVGVGQRKGRPYEEWARFQRECHLKHCPHISRMDWVGEYPDNGRKHADSPYGFKLHAMYLALSQGYRRIMWMDSCMYPTGPLDLLFDYLSPHGWHSITGGTLLIDNCRQDLLDACRISPGCRREIGSGQCLGFDFDNPIGSSIFNELSVMEKAGWFSDRRARQERAGVQHRHDEACLAIILENRGLPWSDAPGRCDVISIHADY